MDSARRDKLLENDLAGSTLQLVDRIRPHARTILAALGIVFVSLAAWTLISSQLEAAKARSWETCLAAMDRGNAQRLEDTIRQHPDTTAAGWAQLILADAALAQGSNLLFADRPKGIALLDEAGARYRQVLSSRPAALLAERAVFGLAKANEARGDLEEARRGYEVVVADHPGGASAGLARDRVAALSREATRQWYDWFAAQKPPAPPPADGAAVTPDTKPVDAATTDAAEPAPPAAGG
jgi:hypothetical protein